jgi:magnesium transporter
MKRLTIVTAMLAPLTVITGVYGMNFDFMPELKWRLGYVWALGLMVGVSVGLFWFFRKKGWI